jgi:hypothetical protein
MNCFRIDIKNISGTISVKWEGFIQISRDRFIKATIFFLKLQEKLLFK